MVREGGLQSNRENDKIAAAALAKGDRALYAIGADRTITSSVKKRVEAAKDKKNKELLRFRDFVYRDLIRGRLSAVDDRIRSLTELGMDRNELLEMIEKIALSCFANFVKNQIRHDTTDAIHERLEEYVKLGVNREALLSVLNKILGESKER